MRSGELSKRITLQYKTRVPDEHGGFNETFVDACTVFAAIWPVSASETIQSGATTMTVTHRIRIRYRTILKPYWRIKYGNRYFAISSIINTNEANKMLDLLCKEAI